MRNLALVENSLVQSSRVTNGVYSNVSITKERARAVSRKWSCPCFKKICYNIVFTIGGEKWTRY